MEYESELTIAPQAGTLRRAAPYVQFLVQLAFAGGLLALLLWRVDIGAVRDEVKGGSYWWLPLAAVANIFSDYFRAIRWREFFRPLKKIGLMFLWSVAILGVACNMALPLRAGEVVRLQVLRRRTGLEFAQIVATIVSEKLLDIVAFSLFLVVGIVFFEDARFLWPLAVVYFVVLIGGVLGARWLAHRALEAPGLQPQPDGKARLWIVTQLRAAGEGLGAFRSRRALAIVSTASIAAWLSESVVYYACGRMLGIDVNPAVYLLVVVAATVAISLPFTQAGLGAFELAITGLLVAFGVDKSQAAAFAIVAHVMDTLPYFVMGPMMAIALKVKPRDLLFVRRAASEPEPVAS